MSEIQSAEAFIDDIGKILIGGWRDSAADYVGSYSAAREKAKNALRARDKAIVERVFAIVYDKCGFVPELNHFTIKDVLRELGGEQ